MKKDFWKVSFGILMLICIVVPLLAFGRLISTYNKIYEFDDIVNKSDIYGHFAGDIKKELDNYLDKIEVRSKAFIESGTIAFLLTIVSGGVLGWCLYVIGEKQKTVVSLEKKVEENKETVGEVDEKLNKVYEEIAKIEAYQRYIELLGRCVEANLLASEWNWIRDDKIEWLQVKSRDALKKIYNPVKEMSENNQLDYKTAKTGFEIISSTKGIFSNIKEDAKKKAVEEFIENCDRIIELLKPILRRGYI